ncbi:MAG: hypothetical protein ACOH5I_19185 [Oligoflexus sp.]
MKRITLIGVAILILMVIIGLVTAMNLGEKSPIYVSGKVVIPEKLMDRAERIENLFVIIYDLDSPMPMPYGAMRQRLGPIIANGQNEIDFFVTVEKLQVMHEMAPKPRRMRVKVRLDLDGMGGRDEPGDITGELEEVNFGTSGVTITADQYIQD